MLRADDVRLEAVVFSPVRTNLVLGRGVGIGANVQLHQAAPPAVSTKTGYRIHDPSYQVLAADIRRIPRRRPLCFGQTYLLLLRSMYVLYGLLRSTLWKRCKGFVPILQPVLGVRIRLCAILVS